MGKFTYRIALRLYWIYEDEQAGLGARFLGTQAVCILPMQAKQGLLKYPKVLVRESSNVE